MTITKEDVLSLAGDEKIVMYDDFESLRPWGVPFIYNHFRREVKDRLMEAGYNCHERRYREDWTCGFVRNRTHFHEPE